MELNEGHPKYHNFNSTGLLIQFIGLYLSIGPFPATSDIQSLVTGNGTS